MCSFIKNYDFGGEYVIGTERFQNLLMLGNFLSLKTWS